MTLQELGSIGEFVAAIATLVTLVYLAYQVRQNTRALQSSTFQAISEQMAANVAAIISDEGVADLLLRGTAGGEGFSDAERVRFQASMVASFRRMEAVYVHSRLGSIDLGMAAGFERSMLTLLNSPGGARWWESAKVTFNEEFVRHVDEWLAAHAGETEHPSMGVALE